MNAEMEQCKSREVYPKVQVQVARTAEVNILGFIAEKRAKQCRWGNKAMPNKMIH